MPLLENTEALFTVKELEQQLDGAMANSNGIWLIRPKDEISDLRIRPLRSEEKQVANRCLQAVTLSSTSKP